MNETEVGSLAINLKIKLDALEKGIETAKKKIKEIENQNEEVKNSNKVLEGSYLALSAIAVASLVKIGGAIKDAVDQYNTYTQAMSSLQDVASYAGKNMSDFADIMSEFSTYITQDDLAATIKNFTLMGYSADDTRKMIEALTNSAIKNRNANYTVSQAVKVASDGYKQGLSTLSDSAGVTENLSVMLDNYAKSIGKTSAQLTEEEKNLAYLNRTMAAAEPFAGAMADYTDTLAGKQGTYNQAMREAQVAYAEAMEPILSDATEKMTSLLTWITQLIQTNPSLIKGITTGTVALGAMTIGVIALKKAKDAYTKSAFAATVAQEGFNAALAANPILIWVSAISVAIGAITAISSAIEEQKKTQEELEEATKRYQEVLSGTYKYTDENVASINKEIDAMKKQKKLLEEILEKTNEKNSLGVTGVEFGRADNEEERRFLKLSEEIDGLNEKLEEARKETTNYGNSIQYLDARLKKDAEWLEEYNNIQKIGNLLNTESARTKKKEAAQVVLTAQEHRKYLDVIKKTNKGTQEYGDAVEALAKVYPEAVSANGPLIDELDRLIAKEEDTANDTYNSTQSMIESYKNFLNEVMGSETKLQEAANVLSIPVDELIPKIKQAIALYEVLYGKSAGEMGGTYTKPTSSSRGSSGSSSYQNKALDNYKNQIEYKKNLDKISAEEEISMYEYAYKNLAKTNDEKMDLEVEIYKLRKQLIEDYIDKEKELLDQRTEDSERWIEEQNLSAREQEAAYDRIIDYHKEYLDKMVADERLSLQQKDAIWREEINTIKDYQKQIREIRIESANNVYEALKSALIAQIDEVQGIEENSINQMLKTLENSKNKRIEMINEEYNARIKAIDDELKALEEAEQKKSRLEEDEDYEKKKKRLEELIAYEHDAVTRASYEKELTKLNNNYKKTLDKRELDDKKTALNAEKDSIKEEQQARIDSINERYEKDKEYLNNRLKAIQDNHEREREMADKNAQIMLLNTEKHQDEIINLLKTYGDEYELLGKTWGEKVVDAFQEKVQGIIDTVERLNTKINNAINSKLNTYAQGMARSAEIADRKSYSNANKDAIASIAKANGVDMSVATSMYKNGVTVVQNNTYNVPVEKPSVMQQKNQQTLQNLGELVRRAT